MRVLERRRGRPGARATPSPPAAAARRLPPHGRRGARGAATGRPRGRPAARAASFFLLGEGSQIPMSAATEGVDAPAAVPGRARRRQRRRRRPRQRLPSRRGRRRADGLGPPGRRLQLLPDGRRQHGLGLRRQLAARAGRPDPGQGAVREPPQRQLRDEGAALPLAALALVRGEHPALGAPRGPTARRPPLGDRQRTRTGRETCEIAVAKPGHPALDEGPVRPAPGRTAASSTTPAGSWPRCSATPSVNIVDRAPGRAAASPPASPSSCPRRSSSTPRALTEILGLPAAAARSPFPGEIYRRNLTDLPGAAGRRAGLRARRATPTSPSPCPSAPSRTRPCCSEALDVGLLSRRLAACLLMTDFPNPVFSRAGAALLAHVPARAHGRSTATSAFSDEMGDAIAAAAPATPEGSPEREFAARWDRGDDVDAFGGRAAGLLRRGDRPAAHPGGLRRLRPPGRVAPRPGPARCRSSRARCCSPAPTSRRGPARCAPTEPSWRSEPCPSCRDSTRPARLPEPTDADRDGVERSGSASVVAPPAAEFPQFFDPTATDVGPDAMAPAVAWIAFPATLLEGRHLPGAAVGGPRTPPARCRTSTASGASSATATA